MNDGKKEFCEKRLEKPSDLGKYQKPGWAYRAQRDAGWPLKTSLERFLERNEDNSSVKEPSEVEWEFLREFKRRYHHYSYSVPDFELDLEWLTIMRHYGAPTRLLDFTYSVYVAGYFAVEEVEKVKETNKKERCYCVWGINTKWCVFEARRLVKQVMGEGADDWLEEKFEDTAAEKKFQETFMRESPIDMVAPLNPFRLSERLTTQHGVFLCPGNVNKTFDDNLKALPGWEKEENILKIIIPHSLRGEILKTLWDMNINRISLFPGLDGFASALGVYHPLAFRETPKAPSPPRG